MKTLYKLFRATTIGLLMLCAALLTVAVVLVVFKIPLSLEPFRPRIQTMASQAIGRPLEISGPVRVTPGLWPALEINSLEIGNPPGWAGEPFLRVDALRGTLSLTGLLSGRLIFGEASAQGLRARLARRADGEENWTFAPAPAAGSDAGSAAADAATSSPAFVELHQLRIENAFLIWEDEATDSSREFKLDQAIAAAPAQSPVRVAAVGELFEQAFDLRLEGGPLDSLLMGDQPWPIDLEARLGDAALRLKANLTSLFDQPAWESEIQLEGAGLAAVGALAGTELPDLGPWELVARAKGTSEGLELNPLHASAGASRLSARGLIDLAADRLGVDASVDVEVLDAEMLQMFAGDGSEGGTAPDTPSKPLSAADVHAAMSSLNAEVKLSLLVQTIINAPVELRDTHAVLAMSADRIEADIATTLVGTPLRGTLRFGASDNSLGLTASVSAEEVDITGPAALLSGDDSVSGRLERLDFRLSWDGVQPSQLLDQVDLRLTLEGADLTYGKDPEADPIPLFLERLSASFDPGRPIELATNGSLLDRDFTVALHTGSLRQWLTQQPRPIHLTATGSGAELRVDGTLEPMTRSGGPSLSLSLTGERFGDLSQWTGVASKGRLPYSLSGDLQLTRDGWRMRPFSARLGRSRVQGKLARETVGGEWLHEVELRFPVLDLGELDQSLRKIAADQPDETEGLTVDVPILSEDIVVADADLLLSIDRLLGRQYEIRHIRLDAHIRDGHVRRAPFRATLDTTTLSGAAKLDLRGGSSSAELSLAGRDVDVGEILRRLRLFEDVKATASSLKARIHVRGGDLDEILRETDLRLHVEDGRWTLYDPYVQAEVMIHVSQAELGARPRQPVSGTVVGTFDEVPVRISWESQDLHTLATSQRRLPFRIEADISEAKLKLSAEVTFPLDEKDMDFSLAVQGRHLDDLEDLLHVSTPHWGPYTANGRLRVEPDGYHVSDLDLRLGSSSLFGRFDLYTGGQKPRLELVLTSDAIQLDDFRLEDWTPTGEPETESQRAVKGLSPDARERLKGLLEAEVLRSADAIVAIEVRDVLSGEDHLGRGKLNAVLQNGRLEVDPLRLDIPAGQVATSFALDRSGDDIQAEFRASIDQIDYGIMARRIDPNSPAAGLLSVDTDLSFRDDDIADLWRSADGRLSFAVWPENLSGNVFDIWAANLFLAVLPRFGVGSASQVNCVVAALNLTDGRIQGPLGVLDTTRVRAKGSGVIDLRNETVDAELRPAPKRPKFFSLATPLVVKGKFSDFRTGVEPGGILETALRWSYAYIAVPFRLLTERSLPRDGSDICTPGVDQLAPAAAEPAREANPTGESEGFSEFQVP